MKQKVNFDSEFCGRVPLHQTNQIQPHGVLMVVDKQDHKILQVSENVSNLFKRSAGEVVSTMLLDYISNDDKENLEKLLASNAVGKLPLVFHVNDVSFLGTIQQQPSFYIVEIDIVKKENRADQSFVSVYQDVKYIMAEIDGCATTAETCRVVARELKKLSGFDKVMVYQFDENWNGDVIAEEKEEGMESYLGLKFPASDIPKQARNLYKKQPFRLIPTVDYEPVKLYPVLNPKTNAFTDLSDTNLRSVAAVHLEYLRNMKVNASMSTRILKDGELWGLIACHHRTPNYLSYEMCSVFELMSNVITTKIGAVQGAEIVAYNTEKQKKMSDLLQSVYQHDKPSAYNEILLSLLEADGVAIVIDQQVHAIGSTPSSMEVEDLSMWLQTNDVREIFHQPSLPSVYEPAEEYAKIASGLLALPVEHTKGNFILAFRAEAVRKVSWGGNPDEAIQYESDGKKYHPRASFQQWQQTVQNTSLPWQNEVLKTAEEVRNVLTTYRLNSLL